MMMSKPTPENSIEDEAPPSFATAPLTKPPSQSAVEDLERRLAMLDGGSSSPPGIVATDDEEEKAPPAPTPMAPPAAVKGGKNALLARIMAAKEKSQQAQTKVGPPKQDPFDLLGDFDAPGKAGDPAPSYDTNFLQPPPAAAPTLAQMPPPAFDAVEQQVSFLPPPPMEAVAPPPPIEYVLPPFSAPAASAPSFEDLLVPHHQQAPPPLSHIQAVPPPVAPPSIDEDILAALDPAERAELLAEQQKIMEQIEKEKANNNASSATARAMAFDQRSSAAVAQVASSYDRQSSRPASRPAEARSKPSNNSGGRTVDLGAGEQVPLHGQERTKAAIKDGTAVIVQCVNCQGWMQVTESASLMFCPTCQVVSPVDKDCAATTADMEAAAQMAADAQLAEKLQNEEYTRGSGGEERARTRRPKPQQKKAEEGQSWYEWMVGTPVAAPPAARGSSEIRRPPALVSAQTGEEVGRSRSYDEGQSLIGASGGGARMAEQKGMFSCVADSISSAATNMTAYNLTTDQEGNVHGVDSSSLLAMPDVSRQRD